MNAVARAQLTFQVLTLLHIYIYIYLHFSVRNHLKTSCWRNNCVFITLCVCWAYFMIRSLRQTRYSHYSDVIMGAMASQISSFTIVYSTVYSGADQRKHQSSASLTFVRGIHRWPVNSPHKWAVTGKMFPFDDVIMCQICQSTKIKISIWWQFS